MICKNLDVTSATYGCSVTNRTRFYFSRHGTLRYGTLRIDT